MSDLVDHIPETDPEPTPTSAPHGCITAIVVAILVSMVGGAGFIWLSTSDFIPQLGASELMTNLVWTLGYGLFLLLPFGLTALLLRSPDYAIWRGMGLAFALAGGHTLVANGLLTLDRSLPFPGIPDTLRHLAVVLYGILILVAARRYFLSRLPDARVLFGLGLGGLTSAAWIAAGALGTPTEILLSLVETLGYSLVSAIITASIFLYDPDYPVRRPFWSAMLAGLVFAGLQYGILAGRGWGLHSLMVGIAFLLIGLIGGTLLTLHENPDPRRAWWAVFGFFFMAFLLPFTFTEGFEATWMPDQMPLAWGPPMLISLLVSTGIALLFLILFAIPKRFLRYTLVAAAIFPLALLVMLGVYLAFGQPGVQPETFFVVLNDQADTSFAQDIEDRDERVIAVYDSLVEHANESQADLRAFLDQRGVEYTPYYLVNAIEVQGNPLLRTQIANRADVSHILESPLTRPLPDYLDDTSFTMPDDGSFGYGGVASGVDAIGADDVWTRLDVTGEGIIVGSGDSGVDWSHPDLRGQYLGSDDNHDYTWFDPWEGTTEPTDSNGHGTHTTGTMVGRNGIGVAPGAQWIACRNLGRNLGNPAYYLDCMQFLFAPFPLDGDPFTDGDPTRGAHITNNSWGCPPEEGCDAITLSIGVEHLRNAGQMFVVSAGNEGPGCSTIWAPANADAGFSVGAIDPYSGEITSFSSRGPITGDGSGRIKPDVVAPGQGIQSSIPGGGYASLPGTSMAGPHVAGLVALLWSANPELIGDIDATEQIIIDTAQYQTAADPCGDSTSDQNNVYGYGAIDAFDAVEAALEP